MAHRRSGARSVLSIKFKGREEKRKRKPRAWGGRRAHQPWENAEAWQERRKTHAHPAGVSRTSWQGPA